MPVPCFPMNLISFRRVLQGCRTAGLWSLLLASSYVSAQMDTSSSEMNKAASGGYFVVPTVPSVGGSGLGVSPAAVSTSNASPAAASRTQRSDTPALSELPAPPPPSEFQKFVSASTGRSLPVFGRTFFSPGKAAGLVENVPVSSDYLVGPGDELLIRAWGSIDVDYRATIDRNGQITLPKIGSFSVAGVKAADLERHLRAQIGRLFTNFQLNVTLGQLRGLSIFVVGPANKPGVYRLPSQSTLLSAVVAAGGPGSTGSMRKIILKRDGQTVSEIDLYDFLVLGDKSKDLQLANGDVVVFQPVGPQVALNGALDTPAIYELQQAQEPLGKILLYAGNLPVMANPYSAQLERVDAASPSNARSVETIRLDTPGLSKLMRDGDVLTVLPISPAFGNAVTLRGYVAEALRHPFTPGMRVLDLIPNKEALITHDFYRRKNSLVQAISGATTSTAMPTPQLAEINWDYATIERLDPQDLSPQVITFNLGQALLQKDSSQNLALEPGDVVTIYSRQDIRGPAARRTRLVAIEGEVMSPGIYQLAPGETLRSLLNRAGGFTPQAYIYGLEFTREETRQRQKENLNNAIARLEALAAAQSAREAIRSAGSAGDASTASTFYGAEAARKVQLARLSKVEPNGRIALELSPDIDQIGDLPEVPLDSGDRIIVPSRPAFVTVGGAVSNINAYLWKPGRTAGDYIKLAGLEEDSDMDNMFILRADGTVQHASDQAGLFGLGSIKSQRLNPGDAVVVPNQVEYETWGRALVRNLKDWTQIFYQFGLGAAAIKTFKN